MLVCSIAFSQNTDETKDSFFSKVYELATEDKLLEYFNLSYKVEITSKSTNEVILTLKKEAIR